MKNFCAILPLKPSGTWGTDDLGRARLLIRSIAKYWRGEEPFPLSIIVPERSDLPAVVEIIAKEGQGRIKLGLAWDDLQITAAGAEPRFTGHSWKKQQIVKLCAAGTMNRNWTLILDADVFAIRPFGPDSFFDTAGRATTDWHKEQWSPRWFNGSAEILRAVPVEYKNAIGFTPQMVCNPSVAGMIKRLAKMYGKGWPEALAAKNWSEFSLYQTYVEKVIGIPLTHLHSREKTFDFFRLEQSTKGEPPAEIARRYGLEA